MAGIDPLSALLTLFQMGQAKAAPYDAAKASSYITKDMFNNLGDYTAIQNTTSPPLDRAFMTIDDKTGKTKWHGPMVSKGDVGAAYSSGDPNKYFANLISGELEGSRTKLPQDEKDKGFLSRLFGGL